LSRGVTAEAFREACAKFASGVAVATVLAPDRTPHGLTVSSFTAVSIDPPLILVCIDYACTFLAHFRASTHFGVNVLAESQRELSVIFAEKPEARFEGVKWYSSASGVPLLQNCLTNLECRVWSIVEAGDHAVFLAEVVEAESRDGQPLLYYNRAYRSLNA
jgi:flavin reductase (DIM6/NTAB) family NADH-FMN oxidoreductase RutF